MTEQNSNPAATLRQQFAYAMQAFSQGNLTACEIACRDMLDLDPGNALANNLLGVIATHAGAWEQAEAFFEAAARAAPEQREISDNLNRLLSAPRPRAKDLPGERYLVIQSWGSGFWSDISNLLGNCLLAEITGRIPVTTWGRNSLFSDGSGKDAFGLYFKPVSEVTPDRLSRLQNATFFPPKWSAVPDDKVQDGSHTGAAYFLNRPETIAISDFFISAVHGAPWIPRDHPMHGKPLEDILFYLTEKYLRPRDEMLAEVESFYRTKLAGGPFVAVHLRGSDKIVEDLNLARTNEAILAKLESIDPAWKIFVLTDDEKLQRQVVARYGDRVVFTDCQRTQTQTGVHNLASTDRVRAGREVVKDVYLALHADGFIGSGMSSVSDFVAVMKKWPKGACSLMGPSLLMDRNPFLFYMEWRHSR